MRLLAAAGPTVTIIFACLLWCLAPRLAGRLLSGATEAELPAGGAAGGLDRRGAMEVAFVVLGMFLLAKGLSWLAVGIYSAVTGASRGLDWTRVLFLPVEATMLAILGLCLLAGGRGIAALVAGVRTVGVAPGDAPVDDLERQTIWRRLTILALLLFAAMLILVAIAVGAWFVAHVPRVPV
jgi:hypothetical protein